MQRISKGVFVLMSIVFICSSFAQTRMVRRIEGDGAFHLKEVQSILTSANDTVKIMTVLPTELRPEKYRDIELKENDEILMVNAKRVKTVQEFEKMYNDLEIGGTVKLGVRRDGQLQLASFEKLDPEALPQGSNVRIRLDTGDGAEGEGDWLQDSDSGEQPVTQTVRLQGGENMRPLFGTGLILDADGDKVKIANILDARTGALGEADVKTGDVLTAINGMQIKDIDHFFGIYDKLKNGEEVKLAYERGEAKMQMTFAKPEAHGRIIRRQN